MPKSARHPATSPTEKKTGGKKARAATASPAPPAASPPPAVAAPPPEPTAPLTVSPPQAGGPLPPPVSRPRVLIAHADAALLRLIREALEAFLDCEVWTTSSALAAFDRVIQEPYRLLILDLHLAPLSGELFYDLVSRLYARVHPGSFTAPPVVWLGLPADQPRQDALTREARTKALLTTPLNLQRLLDTASTLLPRKA